MTTKGLITKEASKQGVDARVVERDYVLAHVVALVSGHDADHALVFKGGTSTMLEQHLVLPFKADVLGVEVVVEALDLTSDDQIVAVCTQGKSRQRIPTFEVPVPQPRPAGWDWVDAYGSWAGER